MIVKRNGRQCQASSEAATDRREHGVPPELARAPLDAAVRALFGVSWGKARHWIERGKVSIGGQQALDPLHRPGAGARITLDMLAARPRADALDGSAIVHLDAHIVVVNKPAGVSTVPYDEGERGTLDERVRSYLARHARRSAPGLSGRPALGVVHRLDKETSGLLVFTRTWLAKKSLSQQFRVHSIGRRYLAIAHGELEPCTFRSHLVVDRGDGLRGSREAQRRPVPGQPAQLAVTHVAVRERLAGATMVECRLETGRTHQIRIHLSEAGHPLVGERVYSKDYLGVEISAARLMLHAFRLEFVHPATEQLMSFESLPPDDFVRTAARLRLGET